jgi:glycosyltransferase involved in cell wall biosynthesis
LRLVIVGVQSDDSLGGALAAGARSLGHEATVVPADRLVSGWRPLIFGRRWTGEVVVAWPLFQRLEQQITAVNPDLVLVIKGRFVTADFVERLRKVLRRPVINYYPDHPLWDSDSRLEAALEAYDEVIVWSAHVADAMKSKGMNAVRVVPFGYDSRIYRPPSAAVETRWEVSVIGQCYPARLRFAEALADRRIYASGLGWRQAVAGGPLAARVDDRTFAGRDTCAIYWSSMLSLNILADWNIPGHNMRTYEIPASGTVMVATRTPEHEALFGDDGAVLVDSPEEAKAATDELIYDEDRRKKIARTGRERVAPHTYTSRIATILERWAS